MPTVTIADAISKCTDWSVRFFGLFIVVVCLAGSTAFAELLESRNSWKELHVPNRPAAKFSFKHTREGPGGLTVETDKSVAFLYREVTGEASQFPRSLAWRWRLELAFTHTDLSTKGKDDRPLAIHLWFSDPDQPSVFGVLGWVFGYPHITHTLTYVLGGNHRPGSVVTNPYYDNGAILVLRGKAVATGRWYTEMRNIERDIKASFPSMPMMKTLKYIAISADTDDAGGASLARIKDLRLSGLGHGKNR
jgi:hypothetical protein